MLDDHRLLGHSWIWVMSSRPLPINGHIRYLLYQAAECDKSRRSNLEFRQCSGRRRARAGPPFWSFFASAFLTKCGEGERKGRTREMVWAQIIIRSGRKPNRSERARSFPSSLMVSFAYMSAIRKNSNRAQWLSGCYSDGGPGNA